MPFGSKYPITDVCFFVEDRDRSIDFYVNKVGFKLRMLAPGFADFRGAGIILAVWERRHFTEAIGLPDVAPAKGVFKACGAMEMRTPKVLDEAYQELQSRGVRFSGPPKQFPWAAYCTYFFDPDDNVWELYTWTEGKPFGEVHCD
jgi:uncharacterized protein